MIFGVNMRYTINNNEMGEDPNEITMQSVIQEDQGAAINLDMPLRLPDF